MPVKQYYEENGNQSDNVVGETAQYEVLVLACRPVNRLCHSFLFKGTYHCSIFETGLCHAGKENSNSIQLVYIVVSFLFLFFT